MTIIGDILDEFFSPLSRERLWIMPENDNYTRIVRQWRPVMNAVTRTKNHLLDELLHLEQQLRDQPDLETDQD